MSYNHNTGKFLLHITTFVPTDYTSIGTSATITDGTDYTSYQLDVTDSDTIILQGYVTGGNASASGDVTFNILGCVDGTLWDTIIVATVTISMSGASKIVESDPLDVRGYRLIKVGTVANADASYTALLAQLQWGKSYGHIK